MRARLGVSFNGVDPEKQATTAKEQERRSGQDNTETSSNSRALASQNETGAYGCRPGICNAASKSDHCAGNNDSLRYKYGTGYHRSGR